MKWSELSEGKGSGGRIQDVGKSTEQELEWTGRWVCRLQREGGRFYWSESPALLIIPKYALLLFISSSLADHTGLVLKNIFTNLIRQPNTPGKLL